MEIRDELTALARQMLERREKEAQPLILFLGRGCADAAGVPGSIEIARQLFRDNDLARQYLEPAGDASDEQALLHAFNEFVADMTPGQRHRMLQSFYAGLPVPAFYQDLALLIKAGFFRRVLTTSIDALLEQALNGAGLYIDKDYQVISLGSAQKTQPPRDYQQTAFRISILKLHGDLAAQQTYLTPEEILDALEPQRAFIKGELSGDLVMAGYEFESEPLNTWLNRVPGQLWWVNPEPLDPTHIARLQDVRSLRIISGSQAYPEEFFGQLVYLLLRRPLKTSLSAEPIQAYSQAQQGLSDVDQLLESLEESDFSDTDYLKDQLYRSRALLQSLQQSSAPGERNLQLQAQIDYQRQRVTELEDQLRSLDGTRRHVLQLLREMQQEVAKASTDPNQVAFFQSQVRAIRREYRRETPDQTIISAAISATLILVERLGAENIDPQLLQELAAFAPSTLSRRA